MSTNTALVSEFCDLMVKRDAEVLRRFFTADAVYHNVGMPCGGRRRRHRREPGSADDGVPRQL